MKDREQRQALAARLRSPAAESYRKDTTGVTVRDPAAAFLALADLVEATGDCRVGKGVASLLPVLEANDLLWECTYRDATHRSAIVAPRE